MRPGHTMPTTYRPATDAEGFPLRQISVNIADAIDTLDVDTDGLVLFDRFVTTQTGPDPDEVTNDAIHHLLASIPIWLKGSMVEDYAERNGVTVGRPTWATATAWIGEQIAAGRIALHSNLSKLLEGRKL